MPDKVVTVREVNDIKVSQVFIGSCTNSSYLDLAESCSYFRWKMCASRM